MRSSSFQYLKKVLPGMLFCSAILLLSNIGADAQIKINPGKVKAPGLSPLLFSTFTKQPKPNARLAERLKPTRYDIINISNYYLTPYEIIRREENRLSPGQQLAEDILTSAVKTLIYGKKSVATIPRF